MSSKDDGDTNNNDDDISAMQAKRQRLMREAVRSTAPRPSSRDDPDLDVPDKTDARRLAPSFTAPTELLTRPPGEDDTEHFATRSVASRENSYQRAARDAQREAAPDSYKEAMLEATLAREKAEFKAAIEKQSAEQDKADESKKRRRKWDEAPTTTSEPTAAAATSTAATTSTSSTWGEAPVGQAAQSSWSEEKNGAAGKKRRSRWDETPVAGNAAGAGGVTPSGRASKWDATPVGIGLATPVAGSMASLMMTPTGVVSAEQIQAARLEREIEQRNRPQSDAELDELLPKKGYKVVDAPAGYVPVRSDAAKLLATPLPMAAGGFAIADNEMASNGNDEFANLQVSGDLPDLKPEDRPYFAKILDGNVDDSGLSPEEERERRIMRLLLKIKNGTPQMRKQALRQITDKAREFGPAALFNQILPLLRSATLEDQERHLLVKVIDRILYKLDDLVRPFVHKILVVIEPLLIDEDYYARAEGREIISNLAKAAGLATMIATLRPDIDHVDEYVRNTTARAFSVVASALGIAALLPFLRAVCASKKSWQARHTGIKIVQQIALLMGCAVLPHLKALVDCVGPGLQDEQQKVRTIAALAISGLAEAATPYGIESFDDVLKPLWYGIRQHRGKGLAAFLKAIGFIIPLMDAEYASYYTKEVMVILIREFASPDEEMKKIVLKVIKQVLMTEGVEAAYVRAEIIPEYFKNFWVRRMALDKRNYKQLVETTQELAVKVGGGEILRLLVPGLKDESEPYRKMVMDAIEQIVGALGVADVDGPLEEQLVDGVLYAFQEQQNEDADVMLRGFGTVVNKLGMRTKPYLPQICGNIKWRLNYKSAAVRQQAADLLARIAFVIMQCNEEQLICHLGVVLYEQLGEEFPDTLGSILGALKAIVNVVGMTKMTPPIKDLLPRLTPILRNRHEKVQETAIELVGRIADRGPEFVSAREWMRLCHEVLEMLKAPKKGIRRAAVNTFGYIAKAIGPQDVLATLLNNLKVQERQNRVCTTVAIAIVAESCSPFTVLPALLNEYRVPELNVQNGVLKAMAFMFEYIGEMAKDYVYAVTSMLEDALADRDAVHRQTAATALKHIALGVAGLSCEEALTHLFNFLWPNIFEISPHVINCVLDAVEAYRIALGPSFMLHYLLQGLFHPARRVRQVYWKIYNTLYIGAQDALVAHYPRLQSPQYDRTELDIFI